MPKNNCILKLAFIRNTIYKVKGHGQDFQITAHTNYFIKKGIEIVDDEHDADVIFAFDFSPKIIFASLKARLKGKKVVVFCIGKLSEDQKWFNRLLINIFANKINVLVKEFKDKFVFKSKINYVPMGIDLQTFKPSSKSKKINNLILSVGLISPRKNYKQLIEIAKKLPNLNFKIVGSIYDIEHYKYLKKIKPKNVEFLGNISQRKLVEMYRKSKVLVHCSKYEMFSGVLLEALACGTPVIALNHQNTKSNFGTIIEYAETNEQFISKIQKLINDKKYYKKKVKMGILFARKFPLKKMLEKNLKMIFA